MRIRTVSRKRRQPEGRQSVVLRTASALVLLAAFFGAHAETYPEKSIRIIVPYPAGGYYDLVARVVGQQLGDRVGQPVVVDNRVGANAIIGTELAAKAPADGYTLLVGGIGPFAINSSLYRQLPYDPVKDFAPIVLVATQPNVLVVHPSVKASTVAELIDLARRDPGRLNYASNGSGSSPHLSAVMFASLARIQINHVPFKGSTPAVTATLSGETDLLFGTASDVLAQIQAGKLRALAVTSAQRIPALPAVPTLAEAGVPEYEANAWFAFYAPAQTPAAIVSQLNALINEILRGPEARQRLSAQGTAVLRGGSPKDLAEFQVAETRKWARIVKSSGARAD